ncbi:UrcA family protein [Sphingomonas sp. CGMCC 1.13654]|uniref:UrcA family protein n=1 Tax=Sphingomonas chungangi TaxID=2683589 RepID=A0A838LD00_9SPHN|nr:UrcA family protein [Sphingomonas chungangi]MBA2936006.1 UrcA family protein [Sphingomonas chungangi]MVW55396.1 UrcA family protein [Sphingomonas chungangi]
MKIIAKILGGLCMGAAAIAVAAPASAQSDEIVVQGHYGRDLQDAPSASMPVSYADLDLTSPIDQDRLTHRIQHAARYLCDKLGESSGSDGLMPSCEQAAVSDAMDRIWTVERDVAPRDTAWVAPRYSPAAYPQDSYPADSYDGY